MLHSVRGFCSHGLEEWGFCSLGEGVSFTRFGGVGGDCCTSPSPRTCGSGAVPGTTNLPRAADLSANCIHAFYLPFFPDIWNTSSPVIFHDRGR